MTVDEDHPEERESVAAEEHETPHAPEEGGHEDPVNEFSKYAREEWAKTEGVAEARPALSHTVSTTSSVVPAVVKVPRGKRTGLLASWTLLYEAEEPKHYPRKIKWLITFMIALAAVSAPMGSSIVLR